MGRCVGGRLLFAEGYISEPTSLASSSWSATETHHSILTADSSGDPHPAPQIRQAIADDPTFEGYMPATYKFSLLV